jgi:hypothetical protein
VLESAAPTKPSSADGLLDAALGQVPEMELAAVMAGRHVVEVEPFLVGVRLAELG